MDRFHIRKAVSLITLAGFIITQCGLGFAAPKNGDCPHFLRESQEGAAAGGAQVARALGAPEPEQVNKAGSAGNLTRRDFLKATGLGALGAVLSRAANARETVWLEPSDEEPPIEFTLQQIRDRVKTIAREADKFVQRQKIKGVRSQDGVNYQGGYDSYVAKPGNPDSEALTKYNRISPYDIALGGFTELLYGRIADAKKTAQMLVDLAMEEERRGFKGLWHFSYNTQGDGYIHPAAPMGATLWALKFLYRYTYQTGDTTYLSWLNNKMFTYVFSQQIMDENDGRYGLVRTGLFNPNRDGYKVYQGNPNTQNENISTEHCADAIDVFRLAGLANEKIMQSLNDPANETYKQLNQFVQQLAQRHTVLVRSMNEKLWRTDHYCMGLLPNGVVNDDVAIDDNTWVASAMLTYGPQDQSCQDRAWKCIEYICQPKKEEGGFLTVVMAKYLEGAATQVGEDITGAFFFRKDTKESPQENPKLEAMVHPEATFGFIHLLWQYIKTPGVPGPNKKNAVRILDILTESMLNMQDLYRVNGGFPNATARIQDMFTTLPHIAGTATANFVSQEIAQDGVDGGFIGIMMPEAFKPKAAQTQAQQEKPAQAGKIEVTSAKISAGQINIRIKNADGKVAVAFNETDIYYAQPYEDGRSVAIIKNGEVAIFARPGSSAFQNGALVLIFESPEKFNEFNQKLMEKWRMRPWELQKFKEEYILQAIAIDKNGTTKEISRADIGYMRFVFMSDNQFMIERDSIVTAPGRYIDNGSRFVPVGTNVVFLGKGLNRGNEGRRQEASAYSAYSFEQGPFGQLSELGELRLASTSGLLTADAVRAAAGGSVVAEAKGITRRDFLKYTGAGIVSLGLGLSPETAELGDLYKGESSRQGQIETDVNRLMAKLTVEEKTAQLMSMGWVGTNPLNDERAKSILEKGIGIFTLYPSNMQSPEQVAVMTAEIMNSSKAAVPPLFNVDRETGRLDNTPTRSTMYPGNMAMGSIAQADIRVGQLLTQYVYECVGDEMAAMGIYQDLAPVADVNSNPKNPVIGIRSFGEDPVLVAGLVQSAIRGLHEAGIAATAKHFPGHGDAAEDSHALLWSITRPKESINETELVPFKAAIEAGVDVIMTAHLGFPAYDDTTLRVKDPKDPTKTVGMNVPATMSQKILTGLLRDQLGFQGVIITDAMEMNAIIDNFGIGEAVVRSMIAGADCFITGADPAFLESLWQDKFGRSYTLQDQLEGYNALLQAMSPEGFRAGNGEVLRITRERLDESVRRVLTLKLKQSLDKTQPEPGTAIKVVGSATHKELAQLVADASVTLVKCDSGKSLEGLKPEQKILVVYPQFERLTPADNSFNEAASLDMHIKAFHNNTEAVMLRKPVAENETAGQKAARESQEKALGEKRPDLAVTEQIDEIIAKSEDSEVIVIGTYFAHQSEFQTNLVNQLVKRTGKRVIVIAMGNPYDIKGFPLVDTYICTYSVREPSMKAVTKALFGKLFKVEYAQEGRILLEQGKLLPLAYSDKGFTGRLPVTIEGIAERGFGLNNFAEGKVSIAKQDEGITATLQDRGMNYSRVYLDIKGLPERGAYITAWGLRADGVWTSNPINKDEGLGQTTSNNQSAYLGQQFDMPILVIIFENKEKFMAFIRKLKSDGVPYVEGWRWRNNYSANANRCKEDGILKAFLCEDIQGNLSLKTQPIVESRAIGSTVPAPAAGDAARADGGGTMDEGRAAAPATQQVLDEVETEAVRRSLEFAEKPVADVTPPPAAAPATTSAKMQVLLVGDVRELQSVVEQKAKSYSVDINIDVLPEATDEQTNAYDLVIKRTDAGYMLIKAASTLSAVAYDLEGIRDVIDREMQTWV